MDNEEEFLNNFFTLVSQLSFDKAREIVEREREANRPSQVGSWGMLLTHLPQVSSAEKSYVELGFLTSKNKGFLRKDTSLRSVYDSLRSDFRRVEEMTKIGPTVSDRLVATVSNHLSQFLTARIELIDFYDKMQIIGTGKQMRFEELLTSIEEIVDKHAMSFSHLVLTSIKASLSLECEILVHLLQAHIEMQLWQFLPSLMLLHKANTKIAAWEQTLQNKDSWKLGFGATFLKANQTPALFQWFIKLKSSFLSKFSLYFYTTLVQQTSVQEIKTLLAKQSCDYMYKIQSYQKRYDAAAVMLVLDTRELEDFRGAGYHLPDKSPDNFVRSQEFYIIVSYPLKPLNHMPNIVKMLKEKISELTAMEKPIFSFCPKDQSTYVAALIDPHISLIVVFDSKKGEKDSNIVYFVSELSLQLRCTKVFVNLKLNAK